MEFRRVFFWEYVKRNRVGQLTKTGVGVMKQTRCPEIPTRRNLQSRQDADKATFSCRLDIFYPQNSLIF